MNAQEAKRRFQGAMISVVTPALNDQTIDLGAYRRNLRFMVDHGVKTGNGVLLVAAAGGEFPMLSVSQRAELMRVAVETVGDEVPIAASIQSNSTREAIELARAAKDAGIALGQLSAPFYYPPTPGDIVAFFRDVATESQLPIMIYNNWWNTLNMNAETIEQLAEIPGVVALKWSAPSFEQYLDGYERFGERLAIIDNTTQYVYAAMLGASAFITHISNFWPAYPLELWNLMRERRYDDLQTALAFDRRWTQWTERVVEFTEGEGPFIKAAMDEVGLASGRPFRPGRAVDDPLRTELRDLFAQFSVPSALIARA